MNRFYNTLNQELYPRLPTSFQNLACTLGGWMRYRSRFSAHFHRTLGDWLAHPNRSVDELHELQRSRLDSMLLAARDNVAYYRDLSLIHI